jgi:hypothetical protein
MEGSGSIGATTLPVTGTYTITVDPTGVISLQAERSLAVRRRRATPRK